MRAGVGKERWLEAGEVAISRRGPHGFTLTAVATEMSRTEGSLYHYWRDGWGTYLNDLVTRWARRRYREQFAPLLFDTTLEPRERLKALVVTGFDLDPAGRALRWIARSDPDLWALVEDGDRRVVEVIEWLLREAGVASRDASQRAMVLYAAFIGMGSLTLPIESDHEQLEAFLAWLLAAPTNDLVTAEG